MSFAHHGPFSVLYPAASELYASSIAPKRATGTTNQNDCNPATSISVLSKKGLRMRMARFLSEKYLMHKKNKNSSGVRLCWRPLPIESRHSCCLTGGS